MTATGVTEEAFLFPCKREELVGVLTRPAGETADVGVLVVVGGPQYRAGSHRMFVQLAREAAGRGVAAFRFDRRGMGDGGGPERAFDAVDTDIRAAIDAFQARVPGLSRVVLWGLCDGASASCLYDPRDARVAGVVLLNPWVRTPEGEARAVLRHYYRRRLLSLAFWKKILTFRLSLGRSLESLTRSLRTARQQASHDHEGPLAERMARGLEASGRPFALLLSELDAVASEFVDEALTTERWKALCASRMLVRRTIPRATHTLPESGALELAMETTAEVLEDLKASAPARGREPAPDLPSADRRRVPDSPLSRRQVLALILSGPALLAAVPWGGSEDTLPPEPDRVRGAPACPPPEDDRVTRSGACGPDRPGEPGEPAGRRPPPPSR